MIIDLNNLISIYYLNTNEDEENNKKSSTIDVVKIKNLNLNELNKNIKEFEKNLSNLDPSTMSTSNSSSANTSTINSNNKSTNNSLYNSNKPNITTNTSSKNQNFTRPMPLNDTSANLIPKINTNAVSGEKRPFQFNKSNNTTARAEPNKTVVDLKRNSNENKNNSALSQGTVKFSFS
jgi:hypothetical protein